VSKNRPPCGNISNDYSRKDNEMRTYYAQEYKNEVIAFESKKTRDSFVRNSILVKSLTAKDAYKIVPELRHECPSLCNRVTFLKG
jgi:hypothetical protein